MEMCTLNSDGEFTQATEDTAVLLSALLMKEYGLSNVHTQLTTHHDIVGWKDCPRWFVNHPEELEAFRGRVQELLDTMIMGDPVSRSTKVFAKTDGDAFLNYISTVFDHVEILGIYDGHYHVRGSNINREYVEGYVHMNQINLRIDGKGETSYVG